MSTTPACRREESALCQSDKAAKPKPPAPAMPVECAAISEKQFMRDHTYYSAISSWLFAIAGATNIGVLCAFSSKVLTTAEQGKPLSDALSNKKYNRIALTMMAFGGACMAVSNWLESKKVVTEWQLGAGKLQRKAAIVDSESYAPADQGFASDIMPAKNWATSKHVQRTESSILMDA